MYRKVEIRDQTAVVCPTTEPRKREVGTTGIGTKLHELSAATTSKSVGDGEMLDGLNIAHMSAECRGVV